MSKVLLSTVFFRALGLSHFTLEEPACAEDQRLLMPEHQLVGVVPSAPANGLLQQQTNASVVHVNDAAGLLGPPQSRAVAHVKDVEPWWSLWPRQSRWSLSFLWGKASPQEVAKPKLAVLISGLADRLVLVPKISVLLNPIVASGWDVELYLSVVGKGKGSQKAWHPIENNESAVTAEGLQTMADVQTLSSAGGWTVRFGELDADSQKVASSFPHDMPIRLRLYPPAETEVGMNVLRRFKTTEQLMHKVQEVEKVNRFNYDFVLVTKDDDHWLGPLNIGWFLGQPGHEQTVFFKNCLNWGGVNDKTLLFGRQAAEAVLPRLYSDFWMKSKQLETNNIEALWQGIITVRGQFLSAVNFEQMPTCDSIYIKGDNDIPFLCQKKCYMCAEYAFLPSDGRFSQPLFCPE